MLVVCSVLLSLELENHLVERFTFLKLIDSGILLVVPLDLAITPMRVLEDPLIGPECRLMLAEGEVDDRFMMMLFLTVERLRRNSSWKPYVLNTWFTIFTLSRRHFLIGYFSLERKLIIF